MAATATATAAVSQIPLTGMRKNSLLPALINPASPGRTGSRNISFGFKNVLPVNVIASSNGSGSTDNGAVYVARTAPVTPSSPASSR